MKTNDISVIEAIRLLNEDAERCALIGRAALNYLLSDKYQGENETLIFQTLDHDIMCRDFTMAEECRDILQSLGYSKQGATCISPQGDEIDIILADPHSPEGVIGGYCNLPILANLWDDVQFFNGIPVPDADSMIIQRLLTSRDNDRDIEAVQIYLELDPDAFNRILQSIATKPDEDQERCLFALYASVIENPDWRDQCEAVMLSNIENKSEDISLCI